RRTGNPLMNASKVLQFLTVATFGVLAASVVGELPSDHRVRLEFDSVYYRDLVDAKSDADLIVEGTIGKVVAREVDYGTEREGNGDGVPMVFHEVLVTHSTLALSGGTLIVAFVDSKSVLSDSATAVAT